VLGHHNQKSPGLRAGVAGDYLEEAVQYWHYCLPYGSLRWRWATHIWANQIASPQALGPLFASGVTKRLDAQLESIMKENNLPSVEVEILAPVKGRYSFVRGTANIARGIPRKRNEPSELRASPNLSPLQQYWFSSTAEGSLKPTLFSKCIPISQRGHHHNRRSVTNAQRHPCA